MFAYRQYRFVVVEGLPAPRSAFTFDRMAWFRKEKKARQPRREKHEIPPDAWDKCEKCGHTDLTEKFERNLNVCPNCDHHRRIRAIEYVNILLDEGTSEETETEIRSTDPLFRPVDVTTAPDGTMYITDMYRGIIQESQWSGPGTYLRQRIDQYGLDKLVKKGRIWRLTYEGMGRRTEQPNMLSETPAQLVNVVARVDDPEGDRPSCFTDCLGVFDAGGLGVY